MKASLSFTSSALACGELTALQALCLGRLAFTPAPSPGRKLRASHCNSTMFFHLPYSRTPKASAHKEYSNRHEGNIATPIR